MVSTLSHHLCLIGICPYNDPRNGYIDPRDAYDIGNADPVSVAAIIAVVPAPVAMTSVMTAIITTVTIRTAMTTMSAIRRCKARICAQENYHYHPDYECYLFHDTLLCSF